MKSIGGRGEVLEIAENAARLDYPIHLFVEGAFSVMRTMMNCEAKYDNVKSGLTPVGRRQGWPQEFERGCCQQTVIESVPAYRERSLGRRLLRQSDPLELLQEPTVASSDIQHSTYLVWQVL